jgi:hypothetical protein
LGAEISCWASWIRRSLLFSFFFAFFEVRTDGVPAVRGVVLLVLQLRLPVRGQVSVQVISHSLTSISGNPLLLPRNASSSALRSIGSREGGNIESEDWDGS